MKSKNVDENGKHYDLCQLYEKMDSKGQETLMYVAGKIYEVQSSIENNKANLKVETDKQEMA
jgi:hypothetical protein